MTVLRDDIAEYLDSQFSGLAASVEQNSDPLIGYEVDINLALRKLGKTRAELATATLEDTQEEASFVLAEYFAARRFWRQLSDRVNVTVDGSQFSYQYSLAAVKQVMEDTAKLATDLGYNVSASAWGMGWLNLDWLESEEMEV